VRAGLAVTDATAEVIVVHDAARPLAGDDVYERVIAAVRDGADAAVPGLPVSDTVKRVDAGGRVVGTVPRDGLVTVQTPQAFAATALRRAHDAGGEATDDAALVEAAGGVVVVVPGDPAAAKITERADLIALERLVGGRR
jgi:2-C-methyl-D-erythritol 4-phosphate cytidylyltransferase